MLSQDDPCLYVCVCVCVSVQVFNFYIFNRFCWNLDHKVLTKIWEKRHLNFLLRLCGQSFNKIGPKMWKLKTQTDIHTHAHAHAHARTHRQGSSWDKIFSPEMTEYKKIWHCVDSKCKQPPTLQNRITIKTYCLDLLVINSDWRIAKRVINEEVAHNGST